jgi:endogenous inhibitor of DNA gyrase (YacG/DUF329 family)
MENMACMSCNKDFNGNAVQHFCSDDCQNEYWGNPKKINIATECPQCKTTFERMIYTIECCYYQGLTLCETCSLDQMVIVGPVVLPQANAEPHA